MLYSTTAAILGFAAMSSAHMIMNTPIPFGKSSLNNSPLAADGSDFPCKQRGGVYEAEGASNPMPHGSTQALKFTGSATHGGGSCQISVTYDAKPNKNSVWKVIHSIEGGCPARGVDGNTGNDANAPSPTDYSFKVPSALPVGEAVLAWSWFNKVGNREMYMNCAPITISSGSSKRDTMLMKRDQAAFDALPNMFTANIGNGCSTANGDLKFPNPGSSVDVFGASGAKYFPPEGTCPTGGPTGGKPTDDKPTDDKPTDDKPTDVKPTATGPGGVFATVDAKPTEVVVDTKPTEVVDTKPTEVVVDTKPTEVVNPNPTEGNGSAGAMAPGSKCATEGTWNCIGGTSFQQCASGVWSVAQQVAGGTACTPGQSAAIQIKAIGSKRAVDFSA